MSEEIVEVKGTTIEIRENSITFISEDKTHPWWRERLNREKDGILCPLILQKMQKLKSNLSRVNDGGQRVCKYNCFITNLPPNPKSSQGKMKVRYKKHLITCLKKNSKDLEKFKNKDVFVYIVIYLRPEKYNTYDVDNFLKAIIDSLKDFIGDDNKVVSILADKLRLENYPKEDLDFFEQVLLVVTNPRARLDILKGF